MQEHQRREESAAGPGSTVGEQQHVPDHLLALAARAGRWDAMDAPGVLRLQRLIGNRATTGLIEQSRRGVTVQRDLSDEQRQGWEKKRGNNAVTRAQQVGTGWKVFRQAPANFARLADEAGAVAELVEILDGMDEAERRYTADRIGGESLKYLSERTGFDPPTRRLIGLLPGVAYVDPQHKYTMKTDDSGKIAGGAVEVPISIVGVEYSNAYGWHWKKQLTGSQLRWQVGLQYAGRSRSGKPGGAKGSGSLLPEIASIKIAGTATATSVPYWGYEDLGGGVLTANGPTAKATVKGIGGKASAGGITTLTGSGGGPPGTLDFINQMDAAVQSLNAGKADNWRKNPMDKGIELTINLVEAGAGALKGAGPAQVATPELQPTAVPEEKVWKYVLSGFETGVDQPTIPSGEIHPIIEMIASDLTEKRLSVESLKPYLTEAGVSSEWKLTFVCEGYASRLWTGAHSEPARQAKNLELSMRRAQNVASALHARFGGDHQYDSVGRGAAFFAATPDAKGHRQDDVAPDSDAEIERLVRKREQQLRDRAKADMFPEDQITRMLEEYRRGLLRQSGRDSDIAMARRVNITVMWRGHTISWGQLASPSPHPAP